MIKKVFTYVNTMQTSTQTLDQITGDIDPLGYPLGVAIPKGGSTPQGGASQQFKQSQASLHIR